MELPGQREHAARVKQEFLASRKKVIATDDTIPITKGYVMTTTYSDSDCTNEISFTYQAVGLCFQPVGASYYRMYVIEDYASCKYILVVQNQYSDSSCTEFESKVTDSGTDSYGTCGSNNNGGYSMIQYYGGIDAPTFPVARADLLTQLGL